MYLPENTSDVTRMEMRIVSHPVLQASECLSDVI